MQKEIYVPYEKLAETLKAHVQAGYKIRDLRIEGDYFVWTASKVNHRPEEKHPFSKP